MAEKVGLQTFVTVNDILNEMQAKSLDHSDTPGNYSRDSKIHLLERMQASGLSYIAGVATLFIGTLKTAHVFASGVRAIDHRNKLSDADSTSSVFGIRLVRFTK
jgi:hypothetical protein